MKRILVMTLLAALCLPLGAQNAKKKPVDLDKEFFHLPDSVTGEYLDNMTLQQRARINDYWIVGV